MRRFQLHQREHGVGEATINGSVSALRFLFDVTLERPGLSRRLVLAHRPRKLPHVLSVDEVARLLEAAAGIKYRAALGVAYGAGLRVSKVAHRKADDLRLGMCDDRSAGDDPKADVGEASCRSWKLTF